MTTGKFKPIEGVEIPEDYVNNMLKVVSNKFSISKLIMKKDYYNEVLKQN